MTQRTNIIEPMLGPEGGHYFTFVEAICSFVTDEKIRVWAQNHSTFSSNSPNVEVEKFFYPKIRRLQLLRLLWKLLPTDEKIFLSTAGTTESYFVGLASRRPIPENKVYLYFHFVRETRRKKIWIYRKLTRKHPNIIAIAPTDTVANFLEECGFKNILRIPYPVGQRPENLHPPASEFGQLLYAGSIRGDKGIADVVNLIEYIIKKRENIPFRIQLSDEPEAYADDVRPSVLKLLDLNYPVLDIKPNSTDFKSYISIYHRSICLQLYKQDDFKDKISGVTLDALMSGCPIVTLPGTWMADTVTKYDSGEIARSTDPEDVYIAVKKVLDNYQHYSENAFKAGKIFGEENSARKLLEVIT